VIKISRNKYIGFFLVIIGLLLNHYVLAALFSGDGDIAFHNKIIIFVIQVIIILIGLLIYFDKFENYKIDKAVEIYLFIFSLLFIVFISEVALRYIGFSPANLYKNIKVYPSKPFFIKDTLLGYKHSPGEFKIVIFGNNDSDSLAFTTEHNINSQREVIKPSKSGKYLSKGDIWSFGCSFTYGWSINGEDTYTSVLQKKLPEYQFFNFGCNGYGTIHQLLQFEKLIKEGEVPRMVLFTYASFHDERNVFSRTRRKNVSRWNHLGTLTQPYARLDSNDELDISMAEVVYKKWPLIEHSSIVNLVESSYNAIEYRNINANEVSKKIVLEILKITKKAKIPVIFAGIYNDKISHDMVDFIINNGGNAVNIALDLAKNEYNNLPYDGHPSAYANSKFASKLLKPMKQILSR